MAFKVTLNGANYVSEERQAAFERSLETPVPARAQAPALPPTQGAGGNGGNGHPPVAAPQVPVAPTVVQTGPEPVQPEPARPAIDPMRVLEGLEWGLARSYDHQSETLQVHQHYLTNEATYASIFAQLMREQSGLFANGGAASETVVRVLEALSRSMEQFHHHQSETLSAHSQFLSQQASYAESFVDVLRHQYGTALSGAALSSGNGHSNGNGNGNGHGNGHGNGGNGHSQPAAYPAVPATAKTPPPVQEQRQVVAQATAPQMVAPAVAVAPVVAAPQTAAPPVVAVPQTAVPQTAVPQTAAPQTAVVIAASSALDLSGDLLAIVSEKTGYPVEMLDLEMDMEADLGIDSIKRVEILGALQDMHPELPEVETDALAELRTLAQVVTYTESRGGAAVVPAAVAPSMPDPANSPAADVETATAASEVDLLDLSGDLLAIVSEKTGYPVEMLELEMDMEADLGIDSIKRVEILGALQDMHPELPEVEADALAELRTLAQVIGYMQGKAALISAPDTAKKV